mgnify:CR=1 FL=1
MRPAILQLFRETQGWTWHMSTVPRKREEFASRTGSTRGTYKLNGVVMGRTHPVNSGSSKLNEAYASRGSFSRCIAPVRLFMDVSHRRC